MDNFDFDAELLKLHEELYRFACRLTQDPDEARDLLQESALRALSNRDKFIEGTNFRAWMYIIVRNEFINSCRNKSNKRSYCNLSLSEQTCFSLLEKGLYYDDNAFDSKEIMRVLKSIPRETSLPFLMFASGFKYREIADYMHLSIGTIKSRIFHCRKKLQRLLADYI